MKKLITAVLLLIIVVSTVSAFSFSPSFHGYAGGTFLHGTSKHLKTVQGKDAPFLRTSFSVGFDALAANFKFKKLEIGAGFAFTYTSQSLAAGISVMQPYRSMGVVLGAERRFENGFGLGLKTRLMFCKNRMKYKFNTVDLEINPSYRMYNAKNFEVSLISPVVLTYRNDSFSVRLHVGFDLQFNAVLGSEKEK